MLMNLSITDKNLSIDGIFEKMQLIYTGCLQELIRQISLQCYERGLLMQKIWNAYISLFERIIVEHKKSSNLMETIYLEESSRVHKAYQKEIEILKSKINILNDENQDLNKNYRKTLDKYKQLKMKHKKILHDYSSQKTNFDNMRTEFNIVQEENIEMKIAIEKISKTKEIDKSEFLFRKLPDKMRKIGSFTLKQIQDAEKNDENNHNTMKNEEIEESFEGVFEDKATDTNDLIVMFEKQIETDKISLNLIENETGFIENLKNFDNKNIDQITQTSFEEIPMENAKKVKKVSVSVFSTKKTKVKAHTEAEINEEKPKENNKTNVTEDIFPNFQQYIDEIEQELDVDENRIKRNIKFIDLLNEKCIGNLISDNSIPGLIKEHLTEFRQNIRNTTNSLHIRVNSVLEENQDQKINIIEKDTDIENLDEELKRKIEEIALLMASVINYKDSKYLIIIYYLFCIE